MSSGSADLKDLDTSVAFAPAQLEVGQCNQLSSDDFEQPIICS
jgi:hypothetical protein